MQLYKYSNIHQIIHLALRHAGLFRCLRNVDCFDVLVRRRHRKREPLMPTVHILHSFYRYQFVSSGRQTMEQLASIVKNV